MGLAKGQVVDVTSQSDPHWWLGQFGEEKGYFPSNYVTTEGVEEPRGTTPTDPPEIVGESPKKLDSPEAPANQGSRSWS